MQIENDNHILILLLKIKQGEENPFNNFYTTAEQQSQYLSVMISARVYHLLTCYIPSNPDYTPIECSLKSSMSDITQKFVSDSTGITIKFP